MLVCAVMIGFASCTQKKDRLSSNTLSITAEPSTLSVQAGQQVQLSATCISAKSDNVSISPSWSVEHNLGTFSPASGKATTFTAGSVSGSGNIYATYGDIRSAAVSLTVATGGPDLGYVYVRNVKYSGGGQPEKPIYAGTGSGGGLAAGYVIGVDDSSGLRNWLTESGGVMSMNYPSGPTWGAVFAVYGSIQPPGSRVGEDLSLYTTLSFEVTGASGGENLQVGIKDIHDLDDGSETKLNVTGITTAWQTKSYTLTSFTTCDRTKVYIPAEFVFSTR